MVIAADGTKWSCASCLKGHRVSGCNHTDRELKLVPKKGRPVTQCHHCRQERKKRSAHVKCDCAEPDKPHHSKEKCIHLREAEERSKSAQYDDISQHDKDVAHLTAVAEEQGCCCHHGGKCSCALLRKNSTDDETPIRKHAVSKPRLESTRSDSSITVIGNGHHKLTQRNHAAHECGMPYKIPLSRSKTDHTHTYAARRSVDNLGLTPKQYSSIPTVGNVQSGEPVPFAMANLFGNAGGLTANKLGIIDFANMDEARASHDESMGAIDDATLEDWATFSSNDLLELPGSSSSMFNLDMNGLAQPALTAASSGTQSEIDEIQSIDDVYIRSMPSIQEDVGLDPSFNVGSPSQSNRRSLPPNFFGNLDFAMPDLGDDWQAQDVSVDQYSKPIQDLELDEPWQDASQARLGFEVISSTGRPLSHSVGSSHAPKIDVLRQLFPDMELENGAQGSSPHSYSEGIYVSNTSPSDDEASTFAYSAAPVSAHSWQDGSLSMPADSYDLAQSAFRH